MALAVASFNLHLGVDGWGRPFDVVEACRQLDADVIALEETFAERDQPSQAEFVADALGYEAFEIRLGPVRLLEPAVAVGTSSWGPGRHGGGRPRVLVVEQPRSASARRTISESAGRSARRGSLNLSLLTRSEVVDRTVIDLPDLRRESVPRKALLVEIRDGKKSLRVAGTHVTHLSRGSPRQFAALGEALSASPLPSVLMGDFNCWGPPLRLLLPGWRRVVRGATWPAWRPHSQVDHILVRGRVRATSGGVIGPLGSDHRAVRAELEW